MNLFNHLCKFISTLREVANFLSLTLRTRVRYKQGKLDEAIELAEQLDEQYLNLSIKYLNLSIKIFGDESYAVAISLNYLANFYYNQKKYSEAEPIYLKALGIWEPLLKDDNFEVFASLNTWANLYSLEKYNEPIYLQFLEIKTRFFNGIISEFSKIVISRMSASSLTDGLFSLAMLYKTQEKYNKAEFLLEQALAIKQRLFPGDHREVVTSLNSLAKLYDSQGKYSEAEPFYLQALEMRQRLFRGDHRDVATSLYNLAKLYDSQGKYSEAETFYLQDLAMSQRLFPGDHLDVAISLRTMANFYYNQNKYNEAEPLYLQDLAMRQRLVKGNLVDDGDFIDVFISICNLAKLYLFQERYREAKPFWEQVLEMSQHLLPGDSSELAIILNCLAMLYQHLGKYTEAESFYLQALEMNQRLFNGDNSQVATSLNNLANIYIIQGKFSSGLERLFRQALEMNQRLFPGDNSEVVTSLNNLALIYSYLEKYSKVEPLYLRALEMNQRLFPGDNSEVATSLHNLGTFYCNQGKYSGAECLLRQALEMNQRLFSGDNYGVATSLESLGVLHYKQGKYTEAESLYLQALEMTQRLFSGDKFQGVTILSNLATLYSDRGKYSEAESLFLQALGIFKYLFNGDNFANFAVATILSNLAINYNDQGKYSEAEPLFLQALGIRERLFNGAHPHPDLVASLNNLAILYTTNQPQQSLELFKKATEVQHRLMSQEFVGSSENDRIHFLDNVRTTQYYLLSLVYQYFYSLEESEEKSQAIHTAFDLVLKRKALSNTASAAFNAAMYSDRYPYLKDSFKRWRERWKQIINLQFSLYLPENLSRLEANKKFLSELHIEVEDLEKKITGQVPELCLENQLVDRKDIALELPENSTLIEFVYFPVYDFTTKQYQTPRYFAFILPAQQPENVQIIDLGEADKIDDLIGKVRQAVSPIHQENMGIATKTWQPEKAEPHNHFFELTNTIFKPLQNYLQGQQLFISPDGVLTLIPFEILSLDAENNQLLIDQYQITYLTAGRDLLRYKYQPNRLASESLVIADPNFDLSVNQTIASTSTPEKKEHLSINLNSLTNEIIETFAQKDNKPFSPVPMTREIAEAAASNFKVNPLLQNDALKTYLTNGKCPQNLVIATHGFFLSQNAPPQPDLKKAEFIQPGFRFRQIQTAENPLLRSGLALAGANTWLLGGEIPPEAGEGIVFAQDVAGFDLWANELIILIACETAVGDVKIGEGVKGLRSAFTAAGARLLIMSLWSVPAQVSILLMNRFFVNYQEKNLRCQQALQEAQNYIRTLTRKELDSLPTGQKIIEQIRSTLREKSPQLVEQWELQNNPLQARYFWGAWVCVGREF